MTYKYNTYSEFLSDYMMGNPVSPRVDMAPHVLEWASKHNFDIPKMRSDIQIARNVLDWAHKNGLSPSEMKEDLDRMIQEQSYYK